MNRDQIDELYEQELSKLQKEFLEKIKNSKDMKLSEKDYRTKTTNVRLKYNKNMKKNLKVQPIYPKVIKPKVKEKKIVPLNVKHETIDISIKEKLKMKSEYYKFKNKIRMKKIKRFFVPIWLIVLGIKMRIKYKKVKNRISFRFDKLKLKIKTKIENVFKKIKEFLSKLYKIVLSVPPMIWNLLKKIKLPKKKKEEAKVDEVKTQENENKEED